MDANDDDATRCLPKFPHIFSPPPQTEIILYPETLDAGGSSHGIAGHGATLAKKQGHNEVKIEPAPKEALYSGLASAEAPPKSPKVQAVEGLTLEVSEEPTTAVDSLPLTPGPEDAQPDQDSPDETTEESSMTATVARRSNVSLCDEDDDTPQQPKPDKRPPDVDTAIHESPGHPPHALTKRHLRSIPEAKLYNLGAKPNRLQYEASKAATTGGDTPRLRDFDTESISTFGTPEASRESECKVHSVFDTRSLSSTFRGSQDAEDRTSFILHNRPRPPHRAERSSSDMMNIGPEASQDIVRKVSDRLQMIRHLREHLHFIDGKGKHIPVANGLYLVGDEDIRDIVRIVLEEGGKRKSMVETERKSTKGSARSRSLPTLDESSNAFIPQSGTLASPATTISLPKTAYTSINSTDMKVHTKTRGADTDTTATVVSRQSVAEITWAQNYPPNYDEASGSHGRAASDCFSPTHGPLPSSLDDRRQSHPAAANSDFVLRHFITSRSTAEILADIMCNKSFEKHQRISDGTVITSFPKLLSRHCTSDWQSPPTDIEDLNKHTSSTLYRRGVDAHCGNKSASSSGSQDLPLKPDNADRSLFAENPFYSKSDCGGADTSRLTTTLAAEKRLSASLGLDWERRRSTQVAGITNETTEVHGRTRPSLMERIRQGSHRLFHRHHSRKSSEVHGGVTEEETLANSTPRSRDSIVIKNTPEPPRPDKTGIYEALTGARLNVHRQRKNTCSEDNRPHVCEDDFLTPSRAGSPA
ncbi:hypothetical protein LCI18_002727 [Fusarium solani-melongenae]|uniref:Uncharacterized protein n=1 Tax=Fusarium solani subsp. cucurbitae TaxID=2747967 RepID=A0ACD3YSA0_FUSSC|nr:hypothetical protein LCI18_002727 [Fusarium solani-melongenae]